jgi:hypothetical protein
MAIMRNAGAATQRQRAAASQKRFITREITRYRPARIFDELSNGPLVIARKSDGLQRMGDASSTASVLATFYHVDINKPINLFSLYCSFV